MSTPTSVVVPPIVTNAEVPARTASAAPRIEVGRPGRRWPPGKRGRTRRPSGCRRSGSGQRRADGVPAEAASPSRWPRQLAQRSVDDRGFPAPAGTTRPISATRDRDSPSSSPRSPPRLLELSVTGRNRGMLPSGPRARQVRPRAGAVRRGRGRRSAGRRTVPEWGQVAAPLIASPAGEPVDIGGSEAVDGRPRRRAPPRGQPARLDQRVDEVRRPIITACTSAGAKGCWSCSRRAGRCPRGRPRWGRMTAQQLSPSIRKASGLVPPTSIPTA